MAAPLPPPGAVLGDEAEFLDSRQRARSIAGGAKGAAGTVAPPSVAGKSAARRAAGGSARASDAAALAASVLRADDDAPLDLLGAELSGRLVEGGDDPVKLLAREQARKRLAAVDAAEALRKAGITVGRDGRMVIPDAERAGKQAAGAGDADGDEDSDLGDADVVRGKAAALREAIPRLGREGARRGRDAGAGRGGRSAPADADTAGGDGEAGAASSSSRAPGGAWDRKGGGRGRSTRPTRGIGGGDSARLSGSQYRSKPGTSGDTLRAGAKFEPFAYVPLDPRSMSGAAGSKSVGRFDGVTASTSHAGRTDRKQQRAAHARGAGAGGSGSLRDAPGRSALGKRRR